MTVDDALIWAARIDELNDGTIERGIITARLHIKLLEDPSNFPDEFFATSNDLRDDPTRELAERLMREGKTTFADARAALDEVYSPSTQPPHKDQ